MESDSTHQYKFIRVNTPTYSGVTYYMGSGKSGYVYKLSVIKYTNNSKKYM